MYYPFRQEGNVKESMLNNTGGVLDPTNTGRPFSSSFASSQNQATNPGSFLHGGNMPSLHNAQTGYNMQSLQNAVPNRNQGLGGLPTAGQQQPVGTLGAGRFGSGNLPGGLPQMSHAGLHGHSTMNARGGLNVGSHAFSGLNGIGGAPGVNGPNVGANAAGNPRAAMVGAGLGAGVNPQLGGIGSRLNASGGLSLGGAGVSIAGGGGAGVGLNRALGTGGLNIGSLNNSREKTSAGIGPQAGSNGLGGQGPGRPIAPTASLLQSAASLQSSSFNTSGELLAMISRGLQGQQSANGQLGGLNLGSDGGGSEALAFDMSEFPQLSTRPSSSGSAGGLPGAGGSLRKGAAVNAIVQQNQEFSIQNEDFPALPGLKGGVDITGEMHHKDLHEGLQGLQSQHYALGRGAFPLGGGYLPQQQQGVGVPATAAAAADIAQVNLRGSGPSHYDQLVSQHQYSQHHQQAQQLRLGSLQHGELGQGLGKEGNPKGSLLFQGGPDRFGLLGLLSVIRMSDPDLTTLALGTDLTTLGLNLNSRENLYKTFASPWADGPTRGEPEFTLPQCYIQPAPRLQHGYFQKFQQDTLFYTFYSMPGDEAQLFAAVELSNRGWVFHKELQMWLTRVPNTEPLIKTNTLERGSFYFFDPSVWETGRKDNFVLQYDMLEARPQLPPSER